MKRFIQFKQVVCMGLMVMSLWLGNAFSFDAHHTAFAKSKSADQTSFFQQPGNSVDAYRQLQRQTFAYRNEGLNGEGSQTGRLGNRVGLAERTSKKLQQRMDQRQDLSSQANSLEDAAGNMVDNTKGAFQRSAKRVQRNLSLAQ